MLQECQTWARSRGASLLSLRVLAPNPALSLYLREDFRFHRHTMVLPLGGESEKV
ncbi:MAG: hypothetical protein AB1445_11635 [Bacillota bacterium]